MERGFRRKTQKMMVTGLVSAIKACYCTQVPDLYFIYIYTRLATNVQIDCSILKSLSLLSNSVYSTDILLVCNMSFLCKPKYCTSFDASFMLLTPQNLCWTGYSSLWINYLQWIPLFLFPVAFFSSQVMMILSWE